MAKRRRKKETPERIRAQPPVLKTIRLRINKPVEKIISKALRRTAFLEPQKPRYVTNKKLQEIFKGIKADIKIPCQAKKADARHNYFSMRKSGKGASRINPKTDRFNSRC